MMTMKNTNKNDQFIYMEITRDKYELPVAVADSAKELANLRGVKFRSIHSCISLHEAGKLKTSKYIRIKVERDDKT